MPLRVTCPGCKSAYSCPDDLRGGRIQCKQCGRMVAVGAPAPVKSSVPAATGGVVKAVARPARPAGVRTAPPPAAAPRPRSAWNGRIAILALGGALAVLLLATGGAVGTYFMLFRSRPVAEAGAGPGGDHPPTASPKGDPLVGNPVAAAPPAATPPPTVTPPDREPSSGDDKPVGRDKQPGGDNPAGPAPRAPDKAPPAAPDGRGALGEAFFRLPVPGGFVLTPDGVTLIVSQPKEGKLIYFDTVADKELRQVEVDLKPAALVLQGKTLFAANEGSSTVYALDAETGKVRKEFDLGGNAVSQLACHPTKGLVYATTATRQVYSIDPASGDVTRTAAMGDFLAVDPIDGKAVYTGIKPGPEEDDTLIIKTDGRGNFRIIWDQWGSRGAILKYVVVGEDLKYVAAQTNAAVNPFSMCLTPDGKRILMTGGGGWRPPPDGGTGGGYFTPAYSTDDLKSMAGQAPQGSNVAFHPVLDIGAANQDGRKVILFNAKSLVNRAVLDVASGADMRPALLTFGGKGCKVILWNGDNPANPVEGLHFIPLDLKEEERAELAKAYGDLPPPPPTAAPEPKTPAGQPKPPADTPKPSPDAPKPPPDGWVAVAGFNDAQGLGSDGAPDSPYPLGKSNVAAGRGEPGWANLWPPSPNAAFQKDVVFEGDGALRLTGTVNYGRQLSDPQKGVFQIEQYVRVPQGGGVLAYVMRTSDVGTTGPMWGVRDGKFRVMDGKENGDGAWLDVAPCKADTWYKVTVVADVSKRRWEFRIDDKKIEGPPLGFRTTQDALQAINYLVETPAGVYIDAIRVGAAPAANKADP